MQALFELVERQLGRSWIDIVEWLREHNALDEVDARLAVGDAEGVVRAVSDAAERFAADVTAGYVTAGQKAASWLDAKATSIIRFDVTNKRAVAWSSQNKLEMVRGFTQEQREVTNKVITEGVRAGTNPREVAKEIRGSIGLTPNQVDHVASYRRALESGDYANALGRELSHGQSDRSIAAAQSKGTALSAEQIDTAVDRYRANYIAYRAEVIARTEALRAVHAGNEELFRQAIERGDIDADAITRTWNPEGGPRTRASHRAMKGQTRSFGEMFTTGAGIDIAYPGDPNAPIEETAQCRCAISTRFRP